VDKGHPFGVPIVDCRHMVHVSATGTVGEIVGRGSLRHCRTTHLQALLVSG